MLRRVVPSSRYGGKKRRWRRTINADLPGEMRVIEVVPVICGNYMKVLWKMIPMDYDYGFKKCFNKDLQWFILSVLRQSDLRHFQSINMLLIAKSSPADLWVYMDVGMLELI